MANAWNYSTCMIKYAIHNCLLLVSADVPHPSELQCLVNENNPETAMQYAQIYAPFLKNLKLMLDWEEMRQCPRFAYRFGDTDSELMRYAWTAGLMEAT